MRPASKPLSDLKPRKVNTIAVDMTDRNGTRWSSPNWLTADLARITDVSGPLPANHLKDRVNAHQAFAAWLDRTVNPETFDWIMSNESAFATSYSAYRNLAQFEASMKTNPNREPQKATESSVND